MSRVVRWLAHHENRMFYWVNKRMQHVYLNYFFTNITHLGGVSATIAASLCWALVGHGGYRLVGLQCLVALTLSHIPVAIIKKIYPRLRPYLVLPQTIICKNPLTDHSFPSGHTTAIFAIIIPMILAIPITAAILLPIGLLVATSRVYLGLHYPSDCLVGFIIGTTTAYVTVVMLG